MYGSLKDYLKSVKTGKLPNPQQVLMGQAPPSQAPPTLSPWLPNGNALSGAAGSTMTSSDYQGAGQQVCLCPYHHNQLSQVMNMSSPARIGGAPNNQQFSATHSAEESVSLYDMDPASKAHATRLLRLLNSEYCLQQITDEHDCCHGDEGGGAAIQLGQSAYSYRRLGEMCVRRVCLDDYPYSYGTLPRNDYYNSYYNYSEQKKEESESPFAETPGTNAPLLPPPPIYVNDYEEEGDAISSNEPHQDCMCHQEDCRHQLPNSYRNLSSSNTCVYCCQCVGGEATGNLLTQHGTGERSSLGGAGNLSSETEGGLSYFEVLDFAQQIARGMEHLEKMKVNI